MLLEFKLYIACVTFNNNLVYNKYNTAVSKQPPPWFKVKYAVKFPLKKYLAIIGQRGHLSSTPIILNAEPPSETTR